MIRDEEQHLLRQPPYSLEAEQAVLGGMMLDPSALERIGDILTAEAFFRHEHRVIFGAAAGLLLAGKPTDILTVNDRLGDESAKVGGLVYLNQLACSVATASNLRRYAEIVAEKAAWRTLLDVTNQAGALVWRTEGAVGDSIDQIAALFGALQRKQAKTLPRRLSDIAIMRTEHYEALERGEKRAGWRTGLPTLDRVLNGGLRPGNLYILAARPGVGKSSLSQSIATTMARDGLPALLLSQEMAAEEVADRAVANAGRVDYSALLSGKMSGEHWNRASEALEALAQVDIYVDDQGSLSLRDIKAKARAIPGLKVLILDYLQLCSSGLKDNNRNAQIEEISRGLKALAKELFIAIVSLSQLNRAVEARAIKRPNLADLRDSGAIEQDADAVVFLWPVRDLDSGSRLIGCAVDKNRQGPVGIEFGLDFHGATQRWAESTQSVKQEQNPKRGGKDFE